MTAIAAILILSSDLMFAQSSSARHDHWVATWATSEEMAVTSPDRPVLAPNIKMPDFAQMKGVHGPPPIPILVNNQTVRMVVHTSIAGEKVRLELSNSFDIGVVSIGSAHIALCTTGSSIDPSSDRELSFSGRKTVDLGPGQILISDPIALDLKPMSNLAVSLYIVRTQGTPTNHNPGLHTAYVSAGDTTAAASIASPTTNSSYVWLRSLDVIAPADSFAISCLGDSITDGFRTTVDANTAWPTLLAKRFSERPQAPPIAVLNAGISGKQVLRDGAGVSALARFDRDALSEPGVRWIVLLEGINDINIHGQITGPGALTADDLIAGYQQLIARAHLHGLKIMGATLTPEGGVWLAGTSGEATRQKLNNWIRHAGAFDAVIDFDAVVRDSAHPDHLRAEFDSGDHIHPNDAGNAAMANAFDLNTFAR
jgi:lysophospholipase L1-like esterase